MSSLTESIYKSCVHEQNAKQKTIFDNYCILLQLLDDLGDYDKDIQAKITTFVTLFDNNYPAFAWFVLDCVIDFLTKVNDIDIFDTQIITGFNILFINYWCYCCNKNIKYLSADIIQIIKENYLFDMEYMNKLRTEKHRKKYELYKLILQQ